MRAWWIGLAAWATACAPVVSEDVGLEAFAPDAVPAQQFIRDAQHRALIFHGMNVNNQSKDAPGRMPDITDAEIAMMAQDWGLNFVRLLIFWDEAEPEPGVYNEAYFDNIETLVDRFAKHDIAVMLDMHQDLYSREFSGDGAPGWAIRDDGEPFTLQTASWALNYFQPAVQRAFDNFWAYDQGEHADLQDHYAALWAHIAARFRDHKGIIGFDLMNEPHPGSDFDAVEVTGRKEAENGGISRQFDENKLGPFYQRVIDAIRTEDTEHWLFFESRYGAPGNGSPSYLPLLSDPREGDPKLVFAPHLYSFDLEASHVYKADDPTVPFWVARRTEELARHPMPLLLGEWGLDVKNSGNALRFVADVMQACDDMMASWAYWSFDPVGGWAWWDRETGLENDITAYTVRTFPQAVAGEPLAYSFEPDTLAFTLSWRDRDDVTGPTEVFVPRSRFPRGVQVKMTDPLGSWSYEWSDAKPNVLEITTTVQDALHTVVITAVP